MKTKNKVSKDAPSEDILDKKVFRADESRPAMENDTNELIIVGKKKKSDAQAQVNNHGKLEKRKLTKKERRKLEKVLERKDKSLRRESLLQQLAAVQVKPTELSLYSSVKNIGQREKRKTAMPPDASGDSTKPERKINSIAGSNKKRKTDSNDECNEASTDTDNISSDDEIDEAEISRALERFQKKQVEAEKETPKPTPIEAETPKPTRATKYVHVERREEIQEARSKLPIITEEQVIMETISENDIVIICGETGSGKTTQVPQFLYEAGYAEDGFMIGVTEPRRVAAISMSQRINDEMNFPTNDAIVAYQIRYEGNARETTRIKFMTDGVLLKEVQSDFMLSKYSAIIIDEAHERSVFTDILIGLLSRIVPLRNKKAKPLKLIIMSATLRVEDFTQNARLFKQPPPVINVDARQHPVAVHFNRTTFEDYLAEAYRKICKIHRRLPEGGILVFLTGQQEVNVLCSKLRKTFPANCEGERPREEATKRPRKKKKAEKDVKPTLEQVPVVDLDNYSSMPLDEELENLGDECENDENLDTLFDLDQEAMHVSDNENDADDPLASSAPSSNASQPLHVLPLYSLLSSDKQSLIFRPVPEGHRLCVVSTNIAETSLTIPNIKYVVDSGRVKTKFYDRVTGVTTFRVTWTSKASADQRAGRAGRTAPGHCYRLYSSAVFNDEFPKFSDPELKRKPVEDLVLQMKDLGIDRILNFPFPTPPDQEAVRMAEQLLVQLGALDFDKSKPKRPKEDQVTRLTQLGKTMAHFPVNPRYAKMLTLARQAADESILSYAILLIAGLSVQELLHDSPSFQQLRNAWLPTTPDSQIHLLGDLSVILIALGALEFECDARKSTEFCERFGVRSKSVTEARKLRRQLVNVINCLEHTNLVIDPQMKPPTEAQARVLRQIVMSSMPDRLARLKLENQQSSDTSVNKELKNSYEGLILDQPLFIHPSSVLFKQLPTYVAYVDVIETSKLYMRLVCAFESDWLPQFLPNECSFGRPIIDADQELKQPRFDAQKGAVVCHRESSFGPMMWKVRPVEVEWAPPELELYKWFARFLLDGSVVDSLKRFESVLLASPSTMLKSWAKLQPRTEKLLNALITQNCSTREKLLSIWKSKPDYLLEEYSMWLPESLHFELRLKWPPVTA